MGIASLDIKELESQLLCQECGASHENNRSYFMQYLGGQLEPLIQGSVYTVRGIRFTTATLFCNHCSWTLVYWPTCDATKLSHMLKAISYIFTNDRPKRLDGR